MTAIRKHAVVTRDHKLHLDLEIPQEVPAGEVELRAVFLVVKSLAALRSLGLADFFQHIRSFQGWVHFDNQALTYPVPGIQEGPPIWKSFSQLDFKLADHLFAGL